MPVHPVARYYATHEERAPLTVTDVIDTATWRRTSTYHTILSVFGADHQLALPLRAPPGVIRSFLVLRPLGEEVTDHDRAYARQVQPLLTRVDSHMRELAHLRASLPASTGPDTPTQRAAEIGVTPRELTVLALLAEGLTAMPGR